jgi:hypothetical protein
MSDEQGAALAAPSLTEQERAKYTAIWAIPRYSDHSPGERLLSVALRWL